MNHAKAAKYFGVQVDQLYHLLDGGTLTKEQVEKSGLGEGVLIEQRHLAARLMRLESKYNTVVSVLEQIADTPRKTREQRLAASTVTFLREMEREAKKKFRKG